MRRSFTRRQEWTKKLIASRMGEQLVTVQDLFGHHRTEGIARSYLDSFAVSHDTTLRENTASNLGKVKMMRNKFHSR